MDNSHTWTCHTCGNVGLADGSDGFFYCLRCGSQADDIVDTGVADEDFVNMGGDASGGIYLASHRRQRSHAIKVEPISQYDSIYDSQSQFMKSLGLEDEAPQCQGNRSEGGFKVERDSDYGFQFNEAGFSVPGDFGSNTVRVLSFDDYYTEIRMRYVMGLQIMVQLQCEALVKEFKVNPLICGIVGPIWLRFVSGTAVFDDGWADEVIHESEMQKEEEPADHKPRAKYEAEPHNIHGERAVMIWYRSLRKSIPLACTVAVTFLACHVAKEAILPTDIMKWTLEGRLPYFSAFREIEKRMGQPTKACPISSMIMFRPSQAVSLQKLESLAASVADSIGLDLPPVNFYAIALRYLQDLHLPVDKILPDALKIYEWSMPPGLWLSTNELRLPTRVCVMSILIVAIRMLYNINGFGEWERSLCHGGAASVKSASGSEGKGNGGMNTNFPFHDDSERSDKDPVQPQQPEWDAARLLHHLYTLYDGVADKYGYSKDLSTYLQYCKDVVFAGLEPSFENHEEEKMIEFSWNFYQNDKDSEPAERVEKPDASLNQNKPSREICINKTSKEEKRRTECFSHKTHDDDAMDNDDSPESSLDSDESENDGETSSESHDNEAIRKLKLDMEENKFCYIPPRVKPKRFDYVHYVRKKDKGAYAYVAHADYYIILRSCARAAQVDLRIMHIGVLSFERRLAWIEERIDKVLRVKPPRISCQFCGGEKGPENEVSVDELGLSDLSI
ncbi:LOW QUALITY PROTEIN: TATA box-binding protein-associated factor RNA polymerase I subunit B-like [Neltuma alba]|uniref:LOW QUALITY PROTEIN: TATA box-binding protein-associated factor RNA polymerase I subunit B-like n=1 Tax=Neltuma alba TaxID=207710 RepID=UPI0010A3FD5B|nr:LOW QUALITY PROTEIN: TATA box-binding protein-associated factor RNA polymerase I subunit B-like [Prosopis alba]